MIINKLEPGVEGKRVTKQLKPGTISVNLYFEQKGKTKIQTENLRLIDIQLATCSSLKTFNQTWLFPKKHIYLKKFSNYLLAALNCKLLIAMNVACLC